MTFSAISNCDQQNMLRGDSKKVKDSHWIEMSGFIQVGHRTITCLRALNRESKVARDITDFLMQEANGANITRISYSDLARVVDKSPATVGRALRLLEKYSFIRRERGTIRLNANLSWKSHLHPRDPNVRAWIAPITINTKSLERFKQYETIREVRVVA